MGYFDGSGLAHLWARMKDFFATQEELETWYDDLTTIDCCLVANLADVPSNLRDSGLIILKGDGTAAPSPDAGKPVAVALNTIDCCTVKSLNDVPANLRDGGLIVLQPETGA